MNISTFVDQATAQVMASYDRMIETETDPYVREVLVIGRASREAYVRTRCAVAFARVVERYTSAVERVN